VLDRLIKRRLTRANEGAKMCNECAELDEKIARYRQIVERVLDTHFSEGVARLIAEVEAQKAALHPEQQTSTGG